MNEDALKSKYLKMFKDVTYFYDKGIISKDKSKSSVSYRSIRKAWRKTNNRKKLNREVYHMVRFTIPDYFPELIFGINSIQSRIEQIRYNSSIGALKEDPFTKEFKDIIRRINYNVLHKKNKPVPSLDTIKIFTNSHILLELPNNELSNDKLREVFKYMTMCYNY